MKESEKSDEMLKGKNIVVTGANRGIGLEIVRACARNGANVFACMRNIDDNIIKMKEIETEYRVKIMPVKLCIDDEASVKECASAILGAKVSIDGIVNNAGTVGGKRLFLMTTIQEMKETFDVNFFGAMDLMQRLLKNMIRNQNGAIVNICSTAALDGDPAQFEYVTSKAALAGATKKLAIELGDYGITVNAIAPGVTDTDMLSQMNGEVLEKTLAKTALHRTGRTEEIANMVVFLLSGQCGYITGQTIRVDGGLH